MTRAVISRTGQVAIPKAVRERLRLKPGTELLIDVQGEALVMRRLVSTDSGWRTMRGMFEGGPDLLRDLMKDRAAEIARDNDCLQGR